MKRTREQYLEPLPFICVDDAATDPGTVSKHRNSQWIADTPNGRNS